MNDASTIENLEEEERYEEGQNEVPPSDIVAYNELRSCADLYRMNVEESLQLDPRFQRDFVWKSSDQTRFIDSLIKALPIPSLCFAYDFKKNKWIVIDGLQRISTIVRFLKGDDWKLAKLEDIDPQLSGSSAAAIKNAKSGPERDIYLRVQNQTLPINVLRCDFTKRRHNEYIFTIFHRLNSGGVKLNNQEIRNCIYSGKLNDLLDALDKNASWRRINSMKATERYRFTKQELILRFWAFSERRAAYQGSVVKFLNDYMFENRDPDEAFIAAHRESFEKVVKILSDKAFHAAVPPRLPATVLEAAMIGVASNLDALSALPNEEVAARFERFRADDSVDEKNLAEGLSKKDKVDSRINAAIKIFGGA